jgi:hypothetical protein
VKVNPPNREIHDRVRLWTGLTAGFLMIGSACIRTAEPLLVDYRDPHTGFVVRYPQGWTTTTNPDGTVARFVPPAASQFPEVSPEFILVATHPSATRLDEAARRRVVFTMLPIHGVSLFQRDGRTTSTADWDRFEVTGATGDVEWASIGLLVAGDAAFHLVVCAKPLTQWRTGQHQCIQVITTFVPGALSR